MNVRDKLNFFPGEETEKSAITKEASLVEVINSKSINAAKKYISDNYKISKFSHESLAPEVFLINELSSGFLWKEAAEVARECLFNVRVKISLERKERCSLDCGRMYNRAGEIKKSIKCLEEGLRLDLRTVIHGGIMNTLAYAYGKMGDADKAYSIYKNSYAYADKNKYEIISLIALSQMSEIKIYRNKYDEALSLLSKIDIGKVENLRPHGRVLFAQMMSKSHFFKRDYTKSVNYIRWGERFIEEVGSYQRLFFSVEKELIESLAKNTKPKIKALVKKFEAEWNKNDTTKYIKKSLLAIETNKELLDIERCRSLMGQVESFCKVLSQWK